MLARTVGTSHSPLKMYWLTQWLVYNGIWLIWGLSLAFFGRWGSQPLCRSLGTLHSRRLKYQSSRVRPAGNNTGRCSMPLYSPTDDATTALQLPSHLEGDALNVALLVPVPRQTLRVDWWMRWRRIMARRADWRITGDSLRKRLGRQGRTPPYSR